MKTNNDEKIAKLEDDIDNITRQLQHLIIEQGKLRTELIKQRKYREARRSRDQHTAPSAGEAIPPKKNNKNLQIGDTVEILSRHKNRRGIRARIIGFRGKTQYVVTSSTKAEEEAHSSFSVWKSNVRALEENN